MVPILWGQRMKSKGHFKNTATPKSSIFFTKMEEIGWFEPETPQMQVI